LPALPKESYNPGNDSFSKDVDYDFIEDSPKKPARNGKRKPPASPREKAQKSVEGPSPPKQNKLKPAETQKDEGDKNTERSLSPVSQLILEMEQKNAKEIQTAPVARRTRSSLSKLEPAPPDVASIVTASSKAVPAQTKAKRRGRKKAESSTPINVETQMAAASVVSSLESIVAVSRLKLRKILRT